MVSKSMSTHSNSSQPNQLLHISTVDAELFHLYELGGYFPLTLGENLSSGRYKILYKLGWGGYSTVWAAKDQRLYRIIFCEESC